MYLYILYLSTTEDISLCCKSMFFFKTHFTFLDFKLLPQIFIGSRHLVGNSSSCTAVDFAIDLILELL